jgi:formylglycine-generating enzyme required for sulfatase activity
VNVSSFYLDTFEVTVGRFRKFMSSFGSIRTSYQAGAGANHLTIAANPSYPSNSTGWNKAWESSLPTSSSGLLTAIQGCTNYNWPATAGGDANENRPVNCVTWYEAFLFCMWDGGRLPAAVEWEMVAAGGDNDYVYPWGNTAPQSGSCNCYVDANRGSTVTVGSYANSKSLYGQFDMTGSMQEWIFDFSASLKDWYELTKSACSHCLDYRDSGVRQTRGGSFAMGGTKLTNLRAAAASMGWVPETRDYTTGFRCARERTQ